MVAVESLDVLVDQVNMLTKISFLTERGGTSLVRANIWFFLGVCAKVCEELGAPLDELTAFTFIVFVMALEELITLLKGRLVLELVASVVLALRHVITTSSMEAIKLISFDFGDNVIWVDFQVCDLLFVKDLSHGIKAWFLAVAGVLAGALCFFLRFLRFCLYFLHI